MANKFTITITAIDQATARIRAVGLAISKTFKPVGVQLGHVATAAKNALAPLTSIATTLAAIAGIGTVAGIAALTAEWGHMGLNITNVAAAIGVGALALQSWRGAAVLAGLEADSVNQALANIGDRFEDIKFFRDPQGFVMLRKLGIQVHSLKDGSIDTERAMLDLSRAIAGTRNVQSQRLIARQFGVEALLPLLQKGPAAIRAYRAEAERLNYVMDPTKAADFGRAMARLEVTWQGIKNETLPGLVSALEPLIQKFTSWVQTSEAKQFFTDLGNTIGGLPAKLNKAAEAFGGWKKIALGVGILITASLLAPIVSLAFEIGKLGFAMIALGIDMLPVLTALAVMATIFDAVQKARGKPGFVDTAKGVIGDIAGSLMQQLGLNPAALQQQGAGLFGQQGPAPAPLSLGALAGVRTMDDLGAPLQDSKRMQVDVRFHNAPPGTTASARVGGEPVPVRVGHAMPAGGG